jgi:hypothetical protein
MEFKNSSLTKVAQKKYDIIRMPNSAVGNEFGLEFASNKLKKRAKYQAKTYK